MRFKAIIQGEVCFKQSFTSADISLAMAPWDLRKSFNGLHSPKITKVAIEVTRFTYLLPRSGHDHPEVLARSPRFTFTPPRAQHLPTHMKRPSTRCLLLLSLLFSTVPFSHAAQPEYDLIIRGGKIIDGTANPWFQGDVAVKGDRIAVLGRVEGSAKRVIDANGLVVAPGFIDMHSHSDWVLLEDGNAESKIRQGVTTEVIGESTSAGPFTGKLKPHISMRFPLEQGPDAMNALLSRKATGKVVLTIA